MTNDLRLNEELVADEPEYLVAAIPIHADNQWFPAAGYEAQHQVPERVMEIIVGVARAYGAQFPSRLNAWHERTTFNSAQVPWIIDEILFVGSVLTDPLVKEHTSAIAQVATRVLNEPGILLLAFEGP